MSLPEGDRFSYSKVRAARRRIAMPVGGRVAEELIFGADKVTTGASSDIKMATEPGAPHGHRMGLEREARPDRATARTSRRSSSAIRSPSGRTSPRRPPPYRRGDPPDRRRGRKYRAPHPDRELDELHLLAKALLEHETLSGDEIDAVLRGEKVHRPEPGRPAAPGRRHALLGADQRPRQGAAGPGAGAAARGLSRDEPPLI